MVGQVMAGGVLFTVLFVMLSPFKQEKERADYANLQIKNLKILIKSAKTKMHREVQTFEATTAKFGQVNESVLISRSMGLSAARQQQIVNDFLAIVAAITNLRVRVAKCSSGIDNRYEPAKSLMREARSKSGIDNAFTSTQSLLKDDIDCVKEANASVSQLEDKFTQRWGRHVLH